MTCDDQDDKTTWTKSETKIKAGILILWLFYLSSCNKSKIKNETKFSQPVKREFVSHFNADSAYEFVK